MSRSFFRNELEMSEMSRGQVSGRTKENKTLTLMTTNWPVNLSLIYFLVTSAMVRASYRISSFSFLKRSRKASLPMFMHKTSKMIIYNISTSIGNRLTARNPTKSCQKSYKILFKFRTRIWQSFEVPGGFEPP